MIDRNHITNEGLKSIVAALEKNCPLEVLNLGNITYHKGYNRITCEGINMIATGLINNNKLNSLILGK